MNSYQDQQNDGHDAPCDAALFLTIATLKLYHISISVYIEVIKLHRDDFQVVKRQEDHKNDKGKQRHCDDVDVMMVTKKFATTTHAHTRSLIHSSVCLMMSLQ